MLKKKNGVYDSNNTSAPEKCMSPLTIPGVVERGQCLRCADGIKSESKGVVHTTVKAVPVSFAPHPTYVDMPPQFSELKQPPERLFAASATSAEYLWKNDEFDYTSRDEESLDDDYPLLDMNLCRLEGDHASLLYVNDMDDRKPPAKKSPPQNERSIPTWQDLDLLDVMFDTTQSRGDAATTTNYEDIDPTFLASLPENLRQEVLNQTTTLKTTKPIDTGRSSTIRTILQAATNSTLSNNHSLSDPFLAALPDNIREEIIAEYENNRERQSNRYTPVSATSSCISSTLIEAEIDEDTNDINASNYDPEMLASLPEELRIEILKDERKQREQQRLNTSNEPASNVGAVSVDIPAGYDPETFTALPEYMQHELRDDALRQGANGNHISNGNSCASRHNAPLVLAQPIGFEDASNSASCTYEGEYDIYGKRHGDGELRWSNGDRYVGQFTDGFIEGKGTLSFRDGKFDVHNLLVYILHRIMFFSYVTNCRHRIRRSVDEK